MQPVFKWDEDRAGNILHVGDILQLGLHLFSSCCIFWRCNIVLGVLSSQVVRHPELSIGSRGIPVHWVIISWVLVMQGHEEIIWAVEVRGNMLFTASADKTVRVWDINSKRCVQVRWSEKHVQS